MMIELSILAHFSKIKSPFVPRLHFAFTTKEYATLLTEFSPIGSLARMQHYFEDNEDRGLCCDSVRQFAAEISEGLIHLHENNIIHRYVGTCNCEHHSRFQPFGGGGLGGGGGGGGGGGVLHATELRA